MRKLLTAAFLCTCLSLSARAGIIITGNDMYCDTETGQCCNAAKENCEAFFNGGQANTQSGPSEFWEGFVLALVG